MCHSQLPNIPPYTSFEPDYSDENWTCGACGTSNHNWIDFCPLCGTARSASSFPTAPSYHSTANDAWLCPECGVANSNLTNFCPVCGWNARAAGPAAGAPQEAVGGPFCQLSGNDAGAWYCQNPTCRAANSDLTEDFCPVCGTSRS